MVGWTFVTGQSERLKESGATLACCLHIYEGRHVDKYLFIYLLKISVVRSVFIGSFILCSIPGDLFHTRSQPASLPPLRTKLVSFKSQSILETWDKARGFTHCSRFPFTCGYLLTLRLLFFKYFNIIFKCIFKSWKPTLTISLKKPLHGLLSRSIYRQTMSPIKRIITALTWFVYAKLTL